MRVLMVHDEPIDGGYGAESYVRRLVAGLRAAGDDVVVVAGEIQHTGAGRARDVWDRAARELIRERARDFSPDVINFHNIVRELSPSVIEAAPDVPAVMTVHDFRLLGAFEHSLLGARGYVERVIARRVRRLASRGLAATIGVSDQVSDGLRVAGFPKVSTVRVPAAAPAARPAPAGNCRDVAVIARLAKDKGVDVAIDAFVAATAADPGSRRLLVAGDGPERKRLEQQLTSRPERVQFLGRLDEAAISVLLGRVRLVVVASQPSHRPEGSSLAMVEAAMHGRPVVASNDPAVKEAAALLGNAFVTDWDAASFTSQISRLLTDDALATELGARGLGNAQRLHSIEAVTAATQEVYRTAITGTTP